MNPHTDASIVNLNKFKLQMQDMGLEPLNNDEEKFSQRLLEGGWPIHVVVKEVRRLRDYEASIS